MLLNTILLIFLILLILINQDQFYLFSSLSIASFNQNGAAFYIKSSLKSKLALWINGDSFYLALDKKKKAPGFSLVKKEKSSLTLKGNFPLPTF